MAHDLRSASCLLDRSHLCYKSVINYGLDIANFLVISPQIRYIKVFDLTNKFGRSPATSLNRGSTVLRENDDHKIDKLVLLSRKQILPGSKGVLVWIV